MSVVSPTTKIVTWRFLFIGSVLYLCVCVCVCIYIYIYIHTQITTHAYGRGGADKFLAQPGRKQATATKLGIYSTNSPRSSIHFLARCPNFFKPLKKNRKVVHPTRFPRPTKNGDLAIVFFSPGNILFAHGFVHGEDIWLFL